MGCHTWFYKKSNLKIEKAREILIKRLNSQIEFDKKLINFYQTVNLPFTEIFKEEYKEEFYYTSEKIFNIAKEIFGESDIIFLELIESYPEWNIEYCEKRIGVYNRQIRMINKGLCNCAVYNRMGGIFLKEKNQYYVDTNDFHDVFRKYGYPVDYLFSYEDTIKYIENSENKCSIYDYTYKRLKEFWDKYPEGHIHFA